MLFGAYGISWVIALLLGIYWMPRSSRLNQKYSFFAHNRESRSMLLVCISIASVPSILLMLISIGRDVHGRNIDLTPHWKW
ncbi:MAG: hypothetical protein JWN82_457 [Candidatus Saccharibacteria bacterium]|nr:hypothetical protein [Candidatus Saccharibacteria bacterium]